jgi:hypothetical protein
MSFTFTSLNAVGSDQIGNAGSVFTFDLPKSKVTMQVFGGGGSTNVWLQLSLDGVNFVDVQQALAGSPIVTSDGHIAIAARARLANMTAGDALTAIIAVEPTEE